MSGKERLNSWTLKEYLKNIVMVLVKLPVWFIQVLCCWIPLKKHRIIVYSLKQHGYSCNLKYITEYFRKENAEAFEVLWVVRNLEDYASVRKRGVPVSMLHSMEHFLYRMRAGVVITNDEFYPMFFKRRKQLYINTWHGGINYKKIGYEGLAFTNPIQKLIYRMNNPCPDYFVSGSRSFTETTSRAFHFPEKVFLACGLPRNDILCHPKDMLKIAEIKAQLGISPEKKILLYAPTFRKGGFGPKQKLDFSAVCACLSRKFGGEWIVLLRQHYFVHSNLNSNERLVINVSDYEDTQELILCSDCLISDYSSCMWDYLLTSNPCFVFAPDLEEYSNSDRSFFIPIEKWPYPVSRNMEELCGQIAAFDPQQFAERSIAHRRAYGAYDNGRACEVLAKIITDNTK